MSKSRWQTAARLPQHELQLSPTEHLNNSIIGKQGEQKGAGMTAMIARGFLPFDSCGLVLD